jgi:hypothetical protein
MTQARAGASPLPSAESLKERLAERLSQGHEEKKLFEERYRYVRSRVREERNTHGKLRERTEEAVVCDPRERDPKRTEGGVAAKYSERDVVVDGALLDRFTFEVEGYEQVAGRTAVRVAFRPVSDDLPHANTVDRFINRTAGTLWLENATLDLLKAEIGLLEHVSFLAGIAGVVYRLDISVERAVTPEGVWYTRSSAWHADYRAFLARKVVQFKERRDEVSCVAPEVVRADEP